MEACRSHFRNLWPWYWLFVACTFAPNAPTTNYEKLRATLREVFMLDKADLDFGNYRILNLTIDTLVQRYMGPRCTAHSLRASFVTVAKLNGADDSKIMNQTKHKTSAMIRRYTRLDNVQQHNAVKDLGL